MRLFILEDKVWTADKRQTETYTGRKQQKEKGRGKTLIPTVIKNEVFSTDVAVLFPLIPSFGFCLSLSAKVPSLAYCL